MSKMIKLTIGATRKALPKPIFVSFFDYGTDAIIYIRNPKCHQCKESLDLSVELIFHGLEHEYVELACRDIIDFTLGIRKGFDRLARKWHKHIVNHDCNQSRIRGFIYG
jgi:hypothetical protein